MSALRTAPAGIVPIARPRAGADRAIAVWLLLCCALVFAMVVVGGMTRLTHSGLSITEWQPIAGAVPPLSEAQWEQMFAKYRDTPEYRQVNRGMSLGEFKRIFWWEYAHRLLGRLIGIAFLVPYLVFLLARRIPPGYAPKLFGLFVLGGLQGALGWYMVESGLTEDARVSPFRLTAHLLLAVAIFGAMLWIALSLLFAQRWHADTRAARATRRLAYVTVALVFAMIASGGFVAGIRAGFAYNTFPLMNGRLVPPEILTLTPWWSNFFWNMATVQFDHRALAAVLALVVPWLAWRVYALPDAPARATLASRLLLAMLALQIALGIATLVYVVPLPLAALHQAGALLVFALAVGLAHALKGSG